MPHPRKLQAMQVQPHFAGRTGPHFYPIPRRLRNQPHQPVDPGTAALNCRRGRKRMNQPRLQIPCIAKVHLLQLFTALVQRK